MRLVRTVFLVAVAAFFMPSPPQERLEPAAKNGEGLPATEFLAVAISTIADVSDFCTRQTAVCDTAHALAVKLEGKAKYGIELLYEWADESNGLTMPQRNTLQPEDLVPEWRPPKA
jgi:hypothetical protein